MDTTRPVSTLFISLASIGPVHHNTHTGSSSQCVDLRRHCVLQRAPKGTEDTAGFHVFLLPAPPFNRESDRPWPTYKGGGSNHSTGEKDLMTALLSCSVSPLSDGVSLRLVR